VHAEELEAADPLYCNSVYGDGGVLSSPLPVVHVEVDGQPRLAVISA